MTKWSVVRDAVEPIALKPRGNEFIGRVKNGRVVMHVVKGIEDEGALRQRVARDFN